MKSLGLAAVVLVGVLFALATQAVGNRHSRASAVFAAQCASCHVVGWGQAYKSQQPHFVDLTESAQHHDAAWLKAWLRVPHANDKGKVCDTTKLDAVQVDLMVGYLTQHAKPLSRQVVVPPQQLRRPSLGEGQAVKQ